MTGRSPKAAGGEVVDVLGLAVSEAEAEDAVVDAGGEELVAGGVVGELVDADHARGGEVAGGGGGRAVGGEGEAGDAAEAQDVAVAVADEEVVGGPEGDAGGVEDLGARDDRQGEGRASGAVDADAQGVLPEGGVGVGPRRESEMGLGVWAAFMPSEPARARNLPATPRPSESPHTMSLSVLMPAHCKLLRCSSANSAI